MAMKKFSLLPALFIAIFNMEANATGIPCPGCAIPFEDLEKVGLVLPPGYEIEISGESVPIQGFDECPSRQSFMSKLFGSSPNEGRSTCVALYKDRSSVPVRVFLPSGMVIEEWEINRETGETESGRFYRRTSLTRPDGSLVVPATQ